MTINRVIQIKFDKVKKNNNYDPAHRGLQNQINKDSLIQSTPFDSEISYSICHLTVHR